MAMLAENLQHHERWIPAIHYLHIRNICSHHKSEPRYSRVRRVRVWIRLPESLVDICVRDHSLGCSDSLILCLQHL